MVLNLRSETAKRTTTSKITFNGQVTGTGYKFIDRAMGDLGNNADCLDTDIDELDSHPSQGIVITKTEVVHTDREEDVELCDLDYKGSRKELEV